MAIRPIGSWVRMMAELRQVPEDEQLARLSEAIYATGLADHLTRPIGELSKGYRQRWAWPRLFSTSRGC